MYHTLYVKEIHECISSGKRRAEGGRVEVMRKRGRRETVPDSCGGAGGMVERVRQKELRGRSNGMGQRFQMVDIIFSERAHYCITSFA